MRVAKLLVILAVVMLATSGSAFAAAGDSCNEAVSILAGTTSGSVATGARWYSFQGTADKTVPMNTSLPGTNFDTRLAVFGTCGGAPIAENSGVGQRKAHLLVQTFPGQTLFIEVSKIGGSGSNFDLSVDDAQLGGCPGTGDCFDPNGTPGCDDMCAAAPCPGCCATVCGVDPFCCTNQWDGLCEAQAKSLCVVVPVDLKNFSIDG